MEQIGLNSAAFKMFVHNNGGNYCLQIRQFNSLHMISEYSTRNTFCGTRYLSHCPTITVTFNPGLLKFYSRCWFPTNPQPQAVTKWHYRSRGHRFRNIWCPVCLLLVSIWTDHISRTVVEILRFKDFGVTTLTFRGHVTSSVTWPLDSWYAVSYIGGPLKPLLYLASLLRYCVKHLA